MTYPTKTITKTPTTHRLESGATIVLPSGLRCEPANNLPKGRIKYWVSELPSDALTHANANEVERYWRIVGFGIGADEVTEINVNNSLDCFKIWQARHSLSLVSRWLATESARKTVFDFFCMERYTGRRDFNISPNV